MHLIGRSPAILTLQQDIADAARSDAKVLISGESGVGKEVVTHLIHSAGARSRGPLVTLNCAGVPDSLLESELFGHVKGSFTGAYRDRPGHLEMAQRGTIFLDEIGEMSLRMQALLLRFLETGEIQRVGGHGAQMTRVDVRVIAATNRDLHEQIGLGAFRSDLYYRINVIHLQIPPLRERREDVPLLLNHFIEAYSARYQVDAPTIDAEVMRRLVEYAWPGNVRELKNVAERLTLRVRTGNVGFADLPPDMLGRMESRTSSPEQVAAYRADLIVDRMVKGGEPFWTAVHEPFMDRDLTREDLRHIVAKGLGMTHGSYKQLVVQFNMPPTDYKRFLNFLRKHGCHMPFQRFRGVVLPGAADPDQGERVLR